MIDLKIVPREIEEMYASDIPVGTVFIGKIGSYPDRLFLRLEEGVIPIENYRGKGHTWGPGASIGAYKPVKKIIVEA